MSFGTLLLQDAGFAPGFVPMDGVFDLLQLTVLDVARPRFDSCHAKLLAPAMLELEELSIRFEDLGHREIPVAARQCVEASPQWGSGRKPCLDLTVEGNVAFGLN